MKKENKFTEEKLIYMIKRLDKMAQLFDKKSVKEEEKQKLQSAQNAMLVRACRNILVMNKEEIMSNANYINSGVVDNNNLLIHAFRL